MPFASAVITTLSAQLLLAWLLHALVSLVMRWRGGGGLRRRWLVVWQVCSRALASIAPYAAATLTLGLLLSARSLDGIWFRPLGFVVLGALPTSSCFLMLHAAQLEACGRRRLARAVARLGGELLFAGALSQLILVWSQLLFEVPVRRALVESTEGAGLTMLGGMVAIGLGAFVAVTAGLAGKPRPACWFATAVFLLGECSLIAAHQIASR